MKTVIKVPADCVLSAEARKEIEGHHMAARRLRERSPAAKRDHPSVLGDRHELHALDFKAIEAVPTVVAIRKCGRAHSVQTAPRWMSGVVARVRGDCQIRV